MSMRAKLIVVIAGTLFLASLIVLPQIIEAKFFNWSKAEPAVAAQSETALQRQPFTVGRSVRNDTSIPVREM